MSDLIERQAAIEAIDCVNEWEVIGITVVDKDDVIRQINILPTIEERKTGMWLESGADGDGTQCDPTQTESQEEKEGT